MKSCPKAENKGLRMTEINRLPDLRWRDAERKKAASSSGDVANCSTMTDVAVSNAPSCKKGIGVATTKVASNCRAACAPALPRFSRKLCRSRRPMRRVPPAIRKKTVAAADVQDTFVVQIAQHLFDGGKMQRSAKRVRLDVVGVILHSAEVGHVRPSHRGQRSMGWTSITLEGRQGACHVGRVTGDGHQFQ